MSLQKPVLETNVSGLTLRGRGKVRDIYEDPQHPERLLIVATDRISAFDYILATGIPDKGRVLTQMSLFWFDFLRETVPTHLLSTDMSGFPAELEGRSMWVKRANMFDVECVARGYLSGSGWKEYQQTGAVCGIGLPPGLRESDALPEPIFTPATKAQTGHDENISFERMVSIVGEDLSKQLRDLTLKIYKQAADYARPRGIILADTKFEFGRMPGSDEIRVADEVLTPDSSRFWPADGWHPGSAQPSFDKQYVRNWLLSDEAGWDRRSDAPPPELPDAVVAATRERYVEAYERLTGQDFAAWPGG
jgi:phosphoribosylaminoimidazole-succinocarboxamide synthase